MLELAKNKQINKKNVHILARFRGWIQAAAALLTNMHLPNFLNGSLNRGKGKYACVPGLNCYSCPAATGACPIGAFQAVIGSSKFKFSYYITGFFILIGVLLGRFVCGFLCPFGWFQELLHKIPFKKFSTKKLKPLRYIKYGVLLIFVILLPLLVTNSLGMGNPFFCKYLCPQGVLEGAIPLSIANASICVFTIRKIIVYQQKKSTKGFISICPSQWAWCIVVRLYKSSIMTDKGRLL